MSGYHDFVFRDGKLVGDFEGMYAAERAKGYDSWKSGDSRHLRNRITNEILADYNFETVLDIGCGKGTATQYLKRQNNQVLGIDISQTAIDRAKETFPDIHFECRKASPVAGNYDLISMQAVLAYIPEWKELIWSASTKTRYAVVAEYIPPNPFGMVRSIQELTEHFAKFFEIKHRVVIGDEVVVLFGRSLQK